MADLRLEDLDEGAIEFGYQKADCTGGEYLAISITDGRDMHWGKEIMLGPDEIDELVKWFRKMERWRK